MENNNKFISFFKKHYQSLSYTILFGLAIASIVYSIIYMTDMWILSTTGYKLVGTYGTDKAVFYDYANSLNQVIFNFGVIVIVLLALGFLFGNKSRKKYYISNYIFGFASGIASIVASIVIMIMSGNLKEKLYLTSYGEIVYADGTSAMIDGKNFFSVIYPEGLKDEIGSTLTGRIEYTHPRSVDTKGFSIESTNSMINIAFVLYTLMAIFGIVVIAITIKKLIEFKKSEKQLKEEI